MAILALHPYNKNKYRKYPIKQRSTLCADNGYVVPDDLIVACSITSVYGKHRIYIKQIYYKEPVVKITIACVLTDEVLGAFSGDVTIDYTSLNLVSYTRNVSGTLVIGSIETLQKITNAISFINPTQQPTTEFEESVIFCYTPPAVSSIRDRQSRETRGFVNFGTLTNIANQTTSTGTQFVALSPETVFNRADKSSFLGNCPTPAIKNINGVFPFSVGESTVENDGNVFIIGVKPVIFYGNPGDAGSLKIATPGVTLDSLCTQKHRLLPPVDVSSFTLSTLEFQNLYYSKPALPAIPAASPPRPERLAGNFTHTTRPEYYYWPQFLKEEYYGYWNITSPSTPTLLSVVPMIAGLRLNFTPPLNNGGVTITNYQYSFDGGATHVAFSPEITSSPVEITNLQTNRSYSVKIRAVNTLGVTGAWSSSLTAKTL